ncbi:RES family NAD+ phosphorylase [Zooshikella marina]|nr:RES family NAD+ phosphorylase [Zooshikella ganghwensis]
MSCRGAEQAGGRWNRKGIPVLYTSDSPSLAALEILVHTNSIDDLVNQYCLFQINIPDNAVEVFDTADIDNDWKSSTYSEATQFLGEYMLEQGILAVKVPSVVVPMQYNIVLNGSHSLYNMLETTDPEPFLFDTRLGNIKM